jgi:hypothetical protein
LIKLTVNLLDVLKIKDLKMRKLNFLLLFGLLVLQGCANRDGEIIDMIKEMQQRNIELKAQISELQLTANSALATLNKISLAQIDRDKKIELLQADLKSVLSQLSAISTQMSVANATSADLKTKLDALQAKCADLIKQVDALTAILDPNYSLAQALKTDLVAFYPFTGNANDVSGNKLNGTVRGATLTSDRTGATNAAYNFDDGQFIEVLGTESKNIYPMSVSLWANIKGGTMGGNLFNKYIPATWNGFMLRLEFSNEAGWGYYIYPHYLNGGSVPNGLIGGYGLPETKFTARNLAADKWFHFVMTVDSKGGKLYIDGKFVDNLDWRSRAAVFSNNLTWHIGGKPGRNSPANSVDGYFFKGKIDDLGVWKKALSETEINYLYLNQFKP